MGRANPLAPPALVENHGDSVTFRCRMKDMYHTLTRISLFIHIYIYVERERDSIDSIDRIDIVDSIDSIDKYR